MLKNQLFGVEVEMTGITREFAAKIVAEVLGSTPSQPDSTCYHTRTIDAGAILFAPIIIRASFSRPFTSPVTASLSPVSLAMPIHAIFFFVCHAILLK